MDLKSETGSKSFRALELNVPHVLDFCLNPCSTSSPWLTFCRVGGLGLLVLLPSESSIDWDQKDLEGLIIPNPSFCSKFILQ